jgi:hypothetical protein
VYRTAHEAEYPGRAIRGREQLEYDLAPAMNRHLRRVQNPVAMDEEITRLRALPYTLIETLDGRHPRYKGAHALPGRAHQTSVIMDGGLTTWVLITVYLPMDILKLVPTASCCT